MPRIIPSKVALPLRLGDFADTGTGSLYIFTELENCSCVFLTVETQHASSGTGGVTQRSYGMQARRFDVLIPAFHIHSGASKFGTKTIMELINFFRGDGDILLNSA